MKKSGLLFLIRNDHFLSDYDCCHQRLAKEPKCFNIDVKGDQFYGSINRTCMDFSRSNYHCAITTPWIEQFNEATAFLDNSQVYGNTQKRQMALRLKKGGRLATHQTLEDFLPSRRELGKLLPMHNGIAVIKCQL